MSVASFINKWSRKLGIAFQETHNWRARYLNKIRKKHHFLWWMFYQTSNFCMNESNPISNFDNIDSHLVSVFGLNIEFIDGTATMAWWWPPACCNWFINVNKLFRKETDLLTKVNFVLLFCNILSNCTKNVSEDMIILPVFSVSVFPHNKIFIISVHLYNYLLNQIP